MARPPASIPSTVLPALCLAWGLLLPGCDPGTVPTDDDDAVRDDDDAAADDDDTTWSDDDTAAVDDDDTASAGPDPYADAVVTFEPGDGAGFGADAMPDVVLGPPAGEGASAGSLDVVSLGDGGVIVLELADMEVTDGPGVDLIVFENPFGGWIETGFVAVSADGETWHEFPCDPHDAAGGYPGCAGVEPVYANPAAGVDPTDPAAAGGDQYDLAELGLASARFVRVRDSGANTYGGTTGGFDLDAVAVVHGP